MITREEAYAWIDSIVEATYAYRKPLQYGTQPWKSAKTYDMTCGDVPVHALRSVVELLGLPVRRSWSPSYNADYIILEYKGLRFTDYAYPKRIGKKVSA